MTTKKTTTTAETTVKAVNDQMESAVAAGKETIEAAVKASADAAQQGYEKAVAITREQVEAAVKAGGDAFKSYEELFAYNKENVDAVMAAGSLWVQGVQDLNKAWFGLAQASLEKNVDVTKALFGAKSLADVVKVQSDYAKTSYQTIVGEGRKLSDMTVKVTEKAVAPLGARVEVTLEKVSKPLAA